MSAYSDTHDPGAISHNLGTAYELGLIADDEIVCELEGATSSTDPGLLIVTDLNVVFAYRPLSGKGRGFALPLGEVVDATASERRWIRKKRGCLSISASGRDLGRSQRDRMIQHTGMGRFVDVLDEDEIPIAYEDNVWLGSRWGRLLVTDRRLGFLMGGVLWHRRFVVSLPFAEVAGSRVTGDPETTDSIGLAVFTREPVNGKYALHFELRNEGSAHEIERLVDALAKGGRSASEEAVPLERIEFECVGDLDRARQIARTIVRQKGFLERRLPRPLPVDALDDLEEETPLEIEPPPVRIALGRGVVQWVNSRGGRLYLWGDTFSDSFDVMKASTEPPEGVEFEPSSAVSEFELFLESEVVFACPMHIGRRWFGFGPGVTVNTGLVETGGI